MVDLRDYSAELNGEPCACTRDDLRRFLTFAWVGFEGVPPYGRRRASCVSRLLRATEVSLISSSTLQIELGRGSHGPGRGPGKIAFPAARVPPGRFLFSPLLFFDADQSQPGKTARLDEVALPGRRYCVIRMPLTWGLTVTVASGVNVPVRGSRTSMSPETTGDSHRTTLWGRHAPFAGRRLRHRRPRRVRPARGGPPL